MKKIFAIALAALTFATSAKALDYVPESGLSFQGLVGLNVSKVTNTPTGTDAKAGFNAGVRAEYMLPKCYGVFLNLGVNYTMKGFKDDGIAMGETDIMTGTVYPDTKYTMKGNACYIEIPLHLGYRYNLSETLGVFADFGPYIAIGTNGKLRTNYEDDLWKDESTRYFRNDKNPYGTFQRCEFGMGYRIGAEYANHHSLIMGMDWGSSDLYRDKYREKFAIENPGLRLPKIHNFNFSLTYGYRF